MNYMTLWMTAPNTVRAWSMLHCGMACKELLVLNIVAQDTPYPLGKAVNVSAGTCKGQRIFLYGRDVPARNVRMQWNMLEHPAKCHSEDESDAFLHAGAGHRRRVMRHLANDGRR